MQPKVQGRMARALARARMAEKPVQRRLAAILAADVVGYSRMMGTDEVGTLASLNVRRREVLAPLVTRHRGRIFKVAGDGVLIEFASAVNAVECAIELQQAMAAANAGGTPGQEIVLRVGINLGDVMVQDSDLYGDSVNIAARLEGIAEPGGIVVSGTARDHVGNRIKADFEDLGAKALKNISQPVRAFRLVVQGAAVATVPRPGGAEAHTSIAVLPFNNLSGQPEQDCFADGLAEDIITELSRDRNLRVVARNTTFTFKGRAVNVAEVGRQLGVDFVLEGSMRQANGRVRVTAQLIDTETGAHAWAERINHAIEDPLTAQDQIVSAIVLRLSLNLNEASGTRRLRHPTQRDTAYTLCMRAEVAWRNGDARLAYELSREAVAADPNYPRALGCLGFFLALGLFNDSTGVSDGDARKEAADLAERTLALDKADAYNMMLCALIYMNLGENPMARRCSELAISRNSKDAAVVHTHGYVLAMGGAHAEGLALMEQAVRGERHVAPGYYSGIADAKFLLGDYDGTLNALEAIVDPAPGVMLSKAAALAQLGRIEDARQIVDHLPTAFDAARYARNALAVYALPADGARLLDAMRKAGVLV